MRPQQQNRRMRGRNNSNNNNNNNNNNRRGPNPLTRNYESNGPDVKIRGSAQQIAEKYATLARDAQSAGDRVMAENYLQHAEHYNRIIAAAQAQMPIQNFQQNRDEFDEDGEEERDDAEMVVNTAEGQPADAGNGPQPVIEGMPAEVALNGENNGRENYRGRDRRERNFQNGNRNGDHQRRDQQRRGEQPADVQVAADGGDSQVDTLPSFVTEEVAPTPRSEEAPRPRARRPRRVEPRDAVAADENAAPAAESSGGETLAPVED